MPIVPRRTILAEREGSGAVCCMYFIFFGLNLRVIYGFCALLQRVGILGYGKEAARRFVNSTLICGWVRKCSKFDTAPAFK
jgi:hypothetical protein